MIYQGDCLEVLKTLDSQIVNCIVTSPPYYGLRDYQVEGQIGLERTPQEYVDKLVSVFREARRVLRDDGTLWLNLGDSFASDGVKLTGRNDSGRGGLDGFQGGQGYGDAGGRTSAGSSGDCKPKDLIGIPWMVAFALRADGWYLRSDIIWHKPNPMPESVKDRPTKSHEYIFLLSKSQKYYYDYEAILEPAAYDGRNDTQFKGSEKYKDSGQTFAERGHERWPTKIRGFKDKEQIDNPQHNGKDIQSYGLSGSGFSGHSGNFDENGESLLYEKDGIPARNKRDVWTVTTKPYKGAHFATFPMDLIEPCILAGCPVGGTVLDPFNGSGTTGAVSIKNNRKYIGIELNQKYIELTNKRFATTQVLMEGL